MERSEFSLLHQNSELDEDESLTFENLNNQSLSVIDEDTKGISGDVIEEELNEDEEDEDDEPEFVEGQFECRYDDDKLSNIEERDLSLEAVLHEESKELEKVRANQWGKVSEELTLEKSFPIGSHAQQEPSTEISIIHSSPRTNINSYPTLLEEGTCATSITQQITEDSSRDLLETSDHHDERTELRDERVALLTAGNDSSEYTHSTGALNNQQRFTKKLHEIEQLIMVKQNKSDDALGNPINGGISELMPGNEETTATITFSSTCSHNGSTISECSSMTPDQSKTKDPIPILKHSHHYQSRGVSQPSTSRNNAGVVFVNTTPDDGSSLAHCCDRCFHRHHHRHHAQRHHHHRHPHELNMAQSDFYPARHQSLHHHHHKGKASKQDCGKCGVYHHHHHHHRNDSRSEVSFGSSKSDVPIKRGKDNLLEQARARSLTRSLGNTALETNTSEDATTATEEITPTGVEATGIEVKPTVGLDRQRSPCNQHHFTCNYCGESTMPPNLVPVTSGQSRFKKRGK